MTSIELLQTAFGLCVLVFGFGCIRLCTRSVHLVIEPTQSEREAEFLSRQWRDRS